MKERLVTLGLALGALALFYALFLPKPVNEQAQPARPLSTEVRDEGYQALWRWLQAQGIRVISLRERYDRLGGTGAAATGNLLITTMPQQTMPRRDELQRLGDWIERGNTLLVQAALDDTPRWAVGNSGEFLRVLTSMTGLEFRPITARPQDEDDEDEATPRPTLREAIQQIAAARRGSIVPSLDHPLLAGVREVATESAMPASRWRARAIDPAALLELVERTDRAAGSEVAEPAMWLRRRGAGQVIVLAFASPFSNALIGEQDNARLFANIAAWSLAPDGAVLFDDSHQGLASYYDASAFFGDSRLHHTLLWILALWLVYVLGWQRLRPRAVGWNPMDVTTFIKVTGGFIAGRVPVGRAALRLCENFFNRIRRRLSLPQDGAPVWDWLAAQAAVPAGDLQRLQRLHASASAGNKVDLIELQNCLVRITGSLS